MVSPKTNAMKHTSCNFLHHLEHDPKQQTQASSCWRQVQAENQAVLARRQVSRPLHMVNQQIQLRRRTQSELKSWQHWTHRNKAILRPFADTQHFGKFAGENINMCTYSSFGLKLMTAFVLSRKPHSKFTPSSSLDTSETNWGRSGKSSMTTATTGRLHNKFNSRKTTEIFKFVSHILNIPFQTVTWPKQTGSRHKHSPKDVWKIAQRIVVVLEAGQRTCLAKSCDYLNLIFSLCDLDNISVISPIGLDHWHACHLGHRVKKIAFK